MSETNEFWKNVKYLKPDMVKILEGSDDSILNRYSVNVSHLTKDQAKRLQREVRRLLHNATKGKQTQ